MKSIYTKIFFQLFLSFLLTGSVLCQESTAQRPDKSSISNSKSAKVTEYDLKYENALISTFKELEQVKDIYKLEQDCPRFNVELDYNEAENLFIREVFEWIEKHKSKYPRAYEQILKQQPKDF